MGGVLSRSGTGPDASSCGAVNAAYLRSLKPVEQNIVKRPTMWPSWRRWLQSIDFCPISPRNWVLPDAVALAPRV